MTDIVNTATQPTTFSTYLLYGLAVGVLCVADIPLRRLCKIRAVNVISDLLLALITGAAFIFLIHHTSNGVTRAYMPFAYIAGISIDVVVYKFSLMLIGKTRKRGR